MTGDGEEECRRERDSKVDEVRKTSKEKQPGKGAK